MEANEEVEKSESEKNMEGSSISSI